MHKLNYYIIKCCVCVCLSLSRRASLADRLKLEEHSGALSLADSTVGSKQVTFTLKKVSLA